MILVTLKTVLHKFCQALGRNQDIESELGQGAETRIGIGGVSDITWYSPNMSGFTLVSQKI